MMCEPPTKFRTIEVPIADVSPPATNARFIGNPATVKAMAERMKAVGVLQAPTAREVPPGSGKYELVFGARRLQAAKLAGLKTFPIVPRELTDQEAAEIAVLENDDRDDLHPLERARGIRLLMDQGYDVETAAARLKRTPSEVARLARLESLSDKWRDLSLKTDSPISEWTPGHLEAIAVLPTETQSDLFDELCSPTSRFHQTLDNYNIRDLKDEIAGFTQRLKDAPWRFTDELLVPDAGSCEACTKRTGHDRLLFPDDDDGAPGKAGKNEKCLDAACFARKRVAACQAKIAQLKAKHANLTLLRNDGGALSEQESKAFGKNLAYSWNYHPCKKSDAKAVPTVAIDGPQAGKLRWMASYAGGRPGSGTGGNGSKPKGTPTSLKERRAKLQKRRDAWVVGEVKARIAKWGKEDVDAWFASASLNVTRPYIAVAAASVFGTQHNRMKHCYGKSRELWKTFDQRLRIGAREGWEAVARDLFVEVLGVLNDRVHYLPSAGHDIAECMVDAERVAILLGIDFRELVTRAVQKFPEPASWANLKADGTPKKSKPKAKPSSAKAPKKRKATRPAKKKVRKSRTKAAVLS